jgi:Flp pilus assembly protein CpaB
MANQKSTTLIAIGVAVFIIAGGLLFLVVHNNDKSSKSSKSKTAATTASTTTLAPGTEVFPVQPTPTTEIQINVPKGDNALAVQMSYYPGLAGYVHPGDSVNIYAINSKGTCTTPGNPEVVALIQSNVKVLSVITSPPAQTGLPSTFLLAVTPQDATQLVFLETYDQMYFSLTGSNESPASTSTIDCSNAF